MLARSAIATSTIEGEGPPAGQEERFLAALTEPGEHVDPELHARLDAHAEVALDREWVLDARRRMFGRSKPALARRPGVAHPPRRKPQPCYDDAFASPGGGDGEKRSWRRSECGDIRA